jgi:thioredoxin-related protein
MKGFIFLFLVLVTTARAQQTPVSANDILQSAFSTAAKENKNVIVIFHASWCVWCHKMDTAIYSKECAKLFNDHYVIVHLTVKESEANRKMENPGGEELLAKYHGDTGGIPYWVILDKNGNVLADSRMPDATKPGSAGSNIGCPVKKEEVDYFMGLLKKTSSLKAEELAVIKKRFSSIGQGH